MTRRSHLVQNHRLAGISLILLLVSACGHSKGNAMTHSDAEGLWQQAREVPAPGADAKHLSDIYTFKYEHELVTLRLMVLAKASWRSPDGFYALKSRWEGDTLQYLPPAGGWTDLAVFQNGGFVALGDGKRREYARITPDQVAERNADIRKPDRPTFDYEQTK
jgi:hypothetical protein